MYKIEELRNKSEAELLVLISEMKGKLLSLRFENATGQLTESHLIKATKKDVARIFTVIKEKQKGISLDKYIEQGKTQTSKRKLLKKEKAIEEESKKAKELKIRDQVSRQIKEISLEDTSKVIEKELTLTKESSKENIKVKDLPLNEVPINKEVKEIKLKEDPKEFEVKDTSNLETKEINVEEETSTKEEIKGLPLNEASTIEEVVIQEEVKEIKEVPSKKVTTTKTKTTVKKEPKAKKEVVKKQVKAKEEPLPETTEERLHKHIDRDHTLIFSSEAMKLNFKKLTIKELKEELDVREVKYKSNLKKQDLINLLSENLEEEEK